jgi:hypothetical protein
MLTRLLHCIQLAMRMTGSAGISPRSGRKPGI